MNNNMVIKEVQYKRNFISRNSGICKGTGNFSQITSKEDDLIRYEVQTKFNVYGINGMGFDGKQFYHYDVGGNLGPRINEENSIEYTTKYNIKKSGKLEDISENCELEEFLLIKGFKKIEVEN